jgi:diaminopimelate epimerase
VGNPHLVVEVDSLSVLPATLLWDDVAEVKSHPEGFNLEFYEVLSESLVSMRVLERGVGETLSCGTGVCAVAQVHMQARNIGACEVKVPGGQLMVQESSGELVLTGPVELIADGFVELT